VPVRSYNTTVSCLNFERREEISCDLASLFHFGSVMMDVPLRLTNGPAYSLVMYSF
jgi:hypothetical protein